MTRVWQDRKSALAANAANPLWQLAAKAPAPLVARGNSAFKSAVDLRLQGKSDFAGTYDIVGL
jgi:hypothetical protein